MSIDKIMEAILAYHLPENRPPVDDVVIQRAVMLLASQAMANYGTENIQESWTKAGLPVLAKFYPANGDQVVAVRAAVKCSLEDAMKFVNKYC